MRLFVYPEWNVSVFLLSYAWDEGSPDSFLRLFRCYCVITNNDKNCEWVGLVLVIFLNKPWKFRI